MTLLNSIGYVSFLKSAYNVTKTVLRLPKYLTMFFYKKFTWENFDKENINLIELESCLATKMSSTFNAIASVIEKEF